MSNTKKTESRSIKLPTPVSVHKAINWIVSVVIIGFAIWSVMLNVESKANVKMALQSFTEIDKKLEDAKKEMALVRDACLQAASPTVVIPTETTDTQNKP